MDTSELVSQLYCHDIYSKLREWGPTGSSAKEALADGYYKLDVLTVMNITYVLAYEQIVYTVSVPVSSSSS